MAGLAGIMSLDGDPPPLSFIEAMESALSHRGPGGAFHYRQGNLGMVQRASTPVDSGDVQPLRDPGGAALIADGGIYDTAGSDEAPQGTIPEPGADLPLRLYRGHGTGFAQSLRGMYAVVLHDPANGRLILARDPFGVKPLYYAETEAGFIFASEPSAILATGIVEPLLVRKIRNELLQLQFTSGRDTVFLGIRRLMPGETIVVAGGRVVERRETAALPSQGPRGMEERDALAALDKVLEESVSRHQRIGLPYGVLLSGGIDSASILAMAERLAEAPVRTFTARFSNATNHDETNQAEAIALSLGADHVEVEFREVDFWCLLPEIVAVLDDPTTDYAVLTTYKLGRVAAETGLKLMLSGEGGDELFAGYDRYQGLMRPWWAGGRLMRGRGNFDGLGILRGELAGWRNGIDDAERRNAGPERSRLQAAQAADCAEWLPNDLLIKLDRCLMAHGVEGRAPLLDPRVAALAFRLPDTLKIRKGLGKYLLRKWLSERVPAADALSGQRGPGVPIDAWIARRGAQIGPLVAQQPGIREICFPDVVEKLYLNLNGKREGFAAWSLLFYALWHRHHILRLKPGPDVFSTLSAT